MATYNPKDIYIQRATANQTWEESPVSVQPNSVLVTDAANNLIMVPTASFQPGVATASFAVSSSHAESASYAPHPMQTSASFADSASHALVADNAFNADFALEADHALAADQATSASYAANIPATSSYALVALAAENATNATNSVNATSASAVRVANWESGGMYYLTFITSALDDITGSTTDIRFDSLSSGLSYDPATRTVFGHIFEITSLTGSVRGNVRGTASYATTALSSFNSVSASYAPQSGVVTNAETASLALSLEGTASYANQALTASFALNASTGNSPSSSWASQSLVADSANTASTVIVSPRGYEGFEIQNGAWGFAANNFPVTNARQIAYVVGNTIYVMGGFANANNGATYTTIWTSSVSNPSLFGASTDTLPHALVYTTKQIIRLGDKLWIFGGATGTAANTLYQTQSILTASVSNPTKWGHAGNLPRGFWYGNVFRVSQSLYLIGGISSPAQPFTASMTASVDNPTNWSVQPTTWIGPNAEATSSYGSHVHVIGNKIYMFGGYDSGTTHRLLLTASTSNPLVWGIGNANWGPIQEGFSFVIGNKIYFTGLWSISGANQGVFSVPITSPSDAITSVSTLPVERASVAGVVFSGSVYLYGGMGSWPTLYSEILTKGYSSLGITSSAERVDVLTNEVIPWRTFAANTPVDIASHITASWSLRSLNSVSSTSASYSATASFVSNAVSASYAPSGAPSVDTAFSTIETGSANGIFLWVTCSFATTEQYLNISSAGNYWFTSSNLPVAGNVRDITLYINNTAPQTSSLTFPSSWKNIGGAWPTSLTASKAAIVYLRAYGANLIMGSVNFEL